MTKDRLGQHQKDILRILFWADRPLHSKTIREHLLFCSFQSYYSSIQRLIERGLVSYDDTFKSFELTDKGLWECIRRGKVI